jgi:MFS family permease
VNSRRSWVIFGVGVFAYLVAVTQRTTIGVVGVEATDRFHSDAAVLSELAVLQLVIYAGMQIPVGVLIDRLGPRWMMVFGTGLMAAGQVVVALAPTIGVAIAGRVLVGGGDAFIFISMIRLVNSWFRGPFVPQLSQWVGNIGQLGQVLSAVPFVLILDESGWVAAFLSAAALSVLAFIGVLVVISDRPVGAVEAPRHASIAESIRQLRRSLARPGTQLGFWSHFVSQSPGTVFSLLWGVPFMVYAVGFSAPEAAAYLTILVGAALVVGPVLGLLTARYPLRRSNIVLTIVSAIAVAWALVLVWPGIPPHWLIVVLLIVLGAGGPGSLIGFDFARTFNPLHSLGSANGIVNVGGFLASFVMMFLIGIILDVENAVHVALGARSHLYDLTDFRWAFAVQYLVIGIGVLLLLRARARTRRRLSEDEGIEVGPIWVAIIARARRVAGDRGGRRGRQSRQSVQ